MAPKHTTIKGRDFQTLTYATPQTASWLAVADVTQLSAAEFVYLTNQKTMMEKLDRISEQLNYVAGTRVNAEGRASADKAKAKAKNAASEDLQLVSQPQWFAVINPYLAEFQKKGNKLITKMPAKKPQKQSLASTIEKFKKLYGNPDKPPMSKLPLDVATAWTNLSAAEMNSWFVGVCKAFLESDGDQVEHEKSGTKKSQAKKPAPKKSTAKLADFIADDDDESVAATPKKMSAKAPKQPKATVTRKRKRNSDASDDSLLAELAVSTSTPKKRTRKASTHVEALGDVSPNVTPINSRRQWEETASDDGDDYEGGDSEDSEAVADE